MNTPMQQLNTLTDTQVSIPAHIPAEERERYVSSYLAATKGTDRLLLMAGDQKIEHMNDDFFGTGIDLADAHPEHLFAIASRGDIGAFATQHGLISQFGAQYPEIPYIVKMNGKTNLVNTEQAEPRSLALVEFEDVLDLRDNGALNIVGIGYTVYIGSEYETEMLAEAGRLVAQAHRHGMIAVIWGYMRGKAVPDEKDAHLIAGAAGVVATLGADFVKVNLPKQGAKSLQEAMQAAGKTGVIISGGAHTATKEFLQFTWDTIHLGGCRGTATGRNLHQRPEKEAIALTKALAAIIYTNATVDDAYVLYEQSLS